MKIKLIYAGIFFLCSCRLPELTIRKKTIISGLIKLDGFYYNKPDYQHFLLYNNGIFRGDFGVSDKRLGSVERFYSDSNYYRSDLETAYAWGLFQIENDSIEIEHWQSRELGKIGKIKYKGKILNDTTLLLNHPVVGIDTFYYQRLEKKPVSTNKFIK